MRSSFNILYLTTGTLILFLLANSCIPDNDSNFRTTYYYSFQEFEGNIRHRRLLSELLDIYSNWDYMINDSNIFIAIPRDTLISKDYLHYYHPYIHRIRLFTPDGDYQTGDIWIEVINSTPAEASNPTMRFIRYKFSSEGRWVMEFDLGDHYFSALPSQNQERRLWVIAGEIARVSFK